MTTCYSLDKVVIKAIYSKTKFNYPEVTIIEVIIEKDRNMTVKKQIKIDEAKWKVNTTLWRELKISCIYLYLLQKQDNYKTFDFLIMLLPHILTLMFWRVLDEIILIEANSIFGYYL